MQNWTFKSLGFKVQFSMAFILFLELKCKHSLNKYFFMMAKAKNSWD